jgi:ribosome recycling factor
VIQERQLAQLEGHDQQLLSFIGKAVTERKLKPNEHPDVIRIQVQRPVRHKRPWTVANCRDVPNKHSKK